MTMGTYLGALVCLALYVAVPAPDDFAFLLAGLGCVLIAIFTGDS